MSEDSRRKKIRKENDDVSKEIKLLIIRSLDERDTVFLVRFHTEFEKNEEVFGYWNSLFERFVYRVGFKKKIKEEKLLRLCFPEGKFLAERRSKWKGIYYRSWQGGSHSKIKTYYDGFKLILETCGMKFIRDIVTTHFDPGKEDHKKPSLREEMIDWIYSKIFNVMTKISKRKLESENLSGDVTKNEGLLFFRLCRITVPLDVMMIIVSYLEKNVKTLNSVGLINEQFYLLILQSWERIDVTGKNIMSIPLSVLRSVKEVNINFHKEKLYVKQLKHIQEHIVKCEDLFLYDGREGINVEKFFRNVARLKPKTPLYCKKLKIVGCNYLLGKYRVKKEKTIEKLKKDLKKRDLSTKKRDKLKRELKKKEGLEYWKIKKNEVVETKLFPNDVKKYLPNLISLEIGYFDVKFEQQDELFENISEITLNEGMVYRRAFMVPDFFSSLPNLKKLKLKKSISGKKKNFYRLVNLIELEYSEGYREDSDDYRISTVSDLKNIFTNFKKLRKITFRKSYGNDVEEYSTKFKEVFQSDCFANHDNLIEINFVFHVGDILSICDCQHFMFDVISSLELPGIIKKKLKRINFLYQVERIFSVSTKEEFSIKFDYLFQEQVNKFYEKWGKNGVETGHTVMCSGSDFGFVKTRRMRYFKYTFDK